MYNDPGVHTLIVVVPPSEDYLCRKIERRFKKRFWLFKPKYYQYILFDVLRNYQPDAKNIYRSMVPRDSYSFYVVRSADFMVGKFLETLQYDDIRVIVIRNCDNNYREVIDRYYRLYCKHPTMDAIRQWPSFEEEYPVINPNKYKYSV